MCININSNTIKEKLQWLYMYFSQLLEIYCDSVYISWINQIKLVFLFIINNILISIDKHIINLFNDKLIV